MPCATSTTIVSKKLVLRVKYDLTVLIIIIVLRFLPMLSSYFLKGVCLLIPHETLSLFRELLHLTILKYKPVILLIIVFQV